MPGHTLLRLQFCIVFYLQMILSGACAMETNEEFYMLGLWRVKSFFSSESYHFS